MLFASQAHAWPPNNTWILSTHELPCIHKVCAQLYLLLLRRWLCYTHANLHDITLRAKGFFCAGTNLGAVTVETIMREAFKGLARFWSVYVCVCWVDEWGGVGERRGVGGGGAEGTESPACSWNWTMLKPSLVQFASTHIRGTIKKLKQNKISQVVLSCELNTAFERGGTVEAMCLVIRNVFAESAWNGKARENTNYLSKKKLQCFIVS